jgi:hypothetical protein
VLTEKLRTRNLHSSPIVTRMITSKRMNWEGQTAKRKVVTELN